MISGIRCPICDEPMAPPGRKNWPHWPFCTRRCKLIDLGRWLGGTYRIELPAALEEPEDTEETPPNPGRSFGRSP